MNVINNMNIIFSDHANERLIERNINKSAVKELIKLKAETLNYNFCKKIDKNHKLFLSKFDLIQLIFTGYDSEKLQQLKHLNVILDVVDKDNFIVVTTYENYSIEDSVIRKNLFTLNRKEVFTNG